MAIIPRRRVAVGLLVVSAFFGLPALGRADPLRMSLKSRVSPPDRPSIPLIADEPVSSLSLALEPAPAEDGQKPAEPLPQTFRERHLGAGQSVVYKLGS